MDIDEWDKEMFDEWEIDSNDIPTANTSNAGNITTSSAPLSPLINCNHNSCCFPDVPYYNNNQFNVCKSGTPPSINCLSGPFPELEIGSSSDEDAPPLPESSKLARENLELRRRVTALVAQSKSVETNNSSLKGQLKKCRNIFKHQIKSMKKAFS